MANRKGNANVPVNWGSLEKRFGESIKENLDILLGHRGSKLNRAVTFKDLLDNKLLSLAGNATLSTAGDDPGNFTTPENPGEITAQFPPAPTGLTASGAFQNIILTWDLQNYSGHSHVEIHRHTSDSISDAELIAQVSGFTGIYSDAAGSDATFYYWVRAVNINNEIGPFNSSAGVQGTTSPDLDVIMDLIEGQITTTELATSLATSVGQISTINGLATALETYTGYTSAYSGNNLLSRIGGIDTSIGSLSSSITTINSSISSLNTATSNLQTSLSDLSANTADVYISASAPTGTIADNSRWYDTSDNNTLHIYFDSDGDGTKEWVSVEDPRIADNESAVTDLNAEVFNSDNTSRLATSTALATTNSTVSSLNGTVSSLSSDITALEGAVFDADSNVKLATVTALNSLISDVQSIYDEDDDTSIVNVIQADVSTLKSTVFDSNNNVLLATTAVTTGLRNDVNTIYDADDANSLVRVIQSDITDLESDVYDADNNVKLATTSALAGLRNEVEAIYDADNDQSLVRVLQSDVTSLNSTVFDSDNNVVLATTSALSGLSSTVDTIYSADDADSLVRVLQSDVTSLNSQVFNSDNSARLATASALEGVESNVSAIYDADDDTSIVRVLQSDVTSLEGAVFDENSNVKLATVTALGGLQSDVEAIYDGEGNASLINTIQSDISSLDAAVFDADNNVKLASATTVSGLQNDILAIYDPDDADAVTQLSIIQSDVSTLDAAVFDTDNNVKLASSTAVSLLNNEIYGTDSPTSATTSRIDTLNSAITNETTGLQATADLASTLAGQVYPDGTSNASAITTINNALFDANNQVKLATAEAVSALETEVYGANDAAASRIDGLFTAIYDEDNNLALATASALETLNTAVNGDGAIADKVDNIATSMFVEGNTEGSLRLATSADLTTVKSEVFPDGTSNTSRINQLSSAIWSGGDPDNDLVLASADVVSDLNAQVFPNGSAQASSISTLQITVNGENGTSGLSGSIETLQEVVGDENGGLSSQYSVKLDTNGHVSGFGLSNTDNDGTPTSAFIVRADKFAIVNPSATGQQSNSPGTTADRIVPFSVQTAATTINGETVPAGVYIDTAFIKNGSIEAAKIGSLTVDKITGTMAQFEEAVSGTISTSRLNIDDATLTASDDGTLQVGSLNANQITAGNISATVMSGTTVYANNLTGDVSVMNSFRDTTLQQFAGGSNTGTYGGDLTFLESQLDATSHTTVGHTPYAQASGWFESTNAKTYRIQMWMKDNSTAAQTLGSPTSVNVQSGSKGAPSTYYMVFSGDKRGQAMQGNVLSNGTITATVSSAIYDSSTSSTRIYHSAASFSTSNTITVASSGAFQLVGETRFKASTNLYMPYSISGTLGRRTTGTVDLKLVMTRYGSSGVGDSDTGSSVDRIGEVNGMIIGMR